MHSTRIRQISVALLIKNTPYLAKVCIAELVFFKVVQSDKLFPFGSKIEEGERLPNVE